MTKIIKAIEIPATIVYNDKSDIIYKRSIFMELLKERILKDGRVAPGGVLKVDSFLDHQIDVTFVSKLAEEWYRLFKEDRLTNILKHILYNISISSRSSE